MVKLLWLDINCSYAHASLALPAIHAQGDCGAEWNVVSATNATNIGTLVEQIVATNPDIIAATMWLFTHEYLLRVIDRVKALLPDSIVILGGPEFLGDNRALLSAMPFVNCVFRGEGELGFNKWLSVSANKDEWGSIEGLCYIDNGNYIDGGIAKVSNFAGLKVPESSRFFNWTKPFVQLETTRGCFNSCAFCVSGAEKPVRFISTDIIRERIKNIYSHGICEIRLLDRTFNGNTKRAIELLKIFAEFGNMRFHLEIHPALLDSDLRDILRSLPKGLLHLEAGIQSLHEESLLISGRIGGLEKSLDGLRFLCSLDNVVTHTDLIAGLPKYTLTQTYADIHTLAELGTQEIQLELLKLLPGTAMRRDAECLGIVYSRSVPYEVLKTSDISVSELQTSRLLSRLLDMYYNTDIWREVTRKLILELDGFLEGFLEWMRKGDYLDQPLSLEKKGLLLYHYVYINANDYSQFVENAWSNANLTLRKIESLKKKISL